MNLSHAEEPLRCGETLGGVGLRFAKVLNPFAQRLRQEKGASAVRGWRSLRHSRVGVPPVVASGVRPSRTRVRV